MMTIIINDNNNNNINNNNNNNNNNNSKNNNDDDDNNNNNIYIYIYCKSSCSKTMYCIYHITTLQRWFKRAKCLPVLWFSPIVSNTLLADLVKYRLSAVALLLCYGDPN